MNHLMIDLETWGKRPGCALRSIGACFFKPKLIKDAALGPLAMVGDDFYANVELEGQQELGLHLDPDTQRWWGEQSAEAQAAFADDPQALSVALLRFTHWVAAKCDPVELRVWCHGAGFDVPIVEACLHALQRPVPWKFWNVRCTRTIYEMAGVSLKDYPRAGTHHNALADAKHQAMCVAIAADKLFPSTETS